MTRSSNPTTQYVPGLELSCEGYNKGCNVSIISARDQLTPCDQEDQLAGLLLGSQVCSCSTIQGFNEAQFIIKEQWLSRYCAVSCEIKQIGSQIRFLVTRNYVLGSNIRFIPGTIFATPMSHVTSEDTRSDLQSQAITHAAVPLPVQNQWCTVCESRNRSIWNQLLHVAAHCLNCTQPLSTSQVCRSMSVRSAIPALKITPMILYES